MPLSLVTGFPGFIGRRLVAALLAEDPETTVVALVEESQLDTARQAAAGVDAGRVELLVGDIATRGLGLDASDLERLGAEVRRVFHLAAVYNLSVPLEVAQRVNVDGTGNVLELCLAAESLDRLVYVSTAYVAGWRKGVVYEHELVMGQDFKNHYESTKFQAEVWVRGLLDRVPTTVLRPAIVVGDSQTGETDKFDGPYYLLRAISRAKTLGLGLPQFARTDAPFNVVPIDYVVAAIIAAAADPATLGETLHLVDTDPLSAGDLVCLLSQQYAGRAPWGRLPPAMVEASLRIGTLRQLLGGAPPQSIAYLNHRVTYDTRRAVDLLAPHGLAPPKFTDYVGPMVRYFEEHEDDTQLRR